MTRELAIECIKTQRQFVDETTRDAFDWAIKLFENLQSEQSEQKVGKWIRHPKWWTCSRCTGMFDYRSNYCPNCGAKMGEYNE